MLVDHELSGAVVGLTLRTAPEDVYRALIEATAFGARTIVETFESSGAAGARVHRRRRPGQEPAPDADLLRRARAARSTSSTRTQGPALGSAIHAAVAAGCTDDVRRASAAMGKVRRNRYLPDEARGGSLRRPVRHYTALHDHFGRRSPMMHELRGSSRGRRRARPHDALAALAAEVAACTRSSSATGS